MADTKTMMSRTSLASKVSLSGQQALQAKRFLNANRDSRKEPEISSTLGKSKLRRDDEPYADLKGDVENKAMSKSIDATRPGYMSALAASQDLKTPLKSKEIDINNSNNNRGTMNKSAFGFNQLTPKTIA